MSDPQNTILPDVLRLGFDKSLDGIFSAGNKFNLIYALIELVN